VLLEVCGLSAPTTSSLTVKYCMKSCEKSLQSAKSFQEAELDEDINLDMANNSECESPDDEGDA